MSLCALVLVDSRVEAVLTLFAVQFSFGFIFIRIHSVVMDEDMGFHLGVRLTCCSWKV